MTVLLKESVFLIFIVCFTYGASESGSAMEGSRSRIIRQTELGPQVEGTGSSYLDTCSASADNCAIYDRNLVCNGTFCVCANGYQFEDTSKTCETTSPSVMNAVGAGTLQGKTSRFGDCLFLVVLDMGTPPATGEKYHWFCSRDESELPNSSSDTLDPDKKGCFDNGLKLTEYGNESPVYIFLSEVMPCGTNTFYVKVFHDKLSGDEESQQIQVEILPQFTPELDIRCHMNCKQAVNPSRRLHIEAYCSNCVKQAVRDAITYKWQITEPVDVDLASITSTVGLKNAALVILEDKLRENTQYEFKVTAALPFEGRIGEELFETYSFQTRSMLTEGTCSINPSEGFVTDTFSVTCSGFSDPYGNDMEYKLKYFTGVRGGEMGKKHDNLLVATRDETITDIQFPLGSAKDDWKLEIFMVVCTDELDPVCISHGMGSIKVSPGSDLNLGDLEKELTDLSGLEGTGAQEIIRKSLSLSSILNSFSDSNATEVQTSVEQRIQVRATIVEQLDKIDDDSIATVLQKSSAIYEVTKEGDELMEEVLATSAHVVSKIIYGMDQYKENATAREVEETSGTLVTVISNVVTQVTRKKMQVDQNHTVTAIDHREVTIELLLALDSVKDSLINSKVIGEDPTIISTGNLIVKLTKRKPTSLAGMKIVMPNNDSSSFDMPTSFPISPDYEDLKVEAVQFNHNPYIWSDSAKDVTTAVTQLQLYSGDKTVAARHLTDPIKIVIPQMNNNQVPINITLIANFTSYVEFNKSFADSKVLVFLDGDGSAMEDGELLELNVYDISLAEIEPNSDDQEPLYNEMFALGEETKLIIVPLEKGGTFNVELKYNGTLDRNISLQMYLSEIKCVYWNEGLERWSHVGCDVSTESKRSEVVCLCTHMTSFAGGFLVMPNKLDFKKDLKGFLAPWENPVGIAAVSAVLFLYILIVICARRKDRKDFLRGAVVNLADNDSSYHCNYVVIVQTGSRRNSGTSANVVIQLEGDMGRSEAHILFSSSNAMCQRGQNDTFVIRTKYTLGRITHVTFWHDNMGKSPEWFVSYCQVLDPQNGQHYDFVCRCWLAKNLGENVTFKTFKVATEKEKRDLEFLFFTNTGIGLNDNHMWFSAFGHKVDSNFTTVQRVSCCLGLFMTYMLCNIMFYGREPESGGEQTMELGPTSITWTEVRIGIMSAVIMLPANMLLVTIFKNCRPRYPRHLYHVHLDTLRMHLTEQQLQHRKASVASVETDPKTSSDEFYKGRKGIEYAEEEYLSQGTLRKESRESVIDPDSEQAIVDRAPSEFRHKYAKCSYFLPWWALYIAWILLFCIVFVSAFFTILYTFNYGLEVSMKWVCALIMAFTTDLFFGQPLKILLIAFTFSLILKTTLSESRSLNINLDHTTFEEFPPSITAGELRKAVRAYRPPKHGPVTGIQQDDKQVYALFYEILRYLIFLYLVLLITYGKQDTNQFYINHFISEQVLDVSQLEEINDLGKVWGYINKTLVPGLYDKNEPEFVNDLRSLRLSPPLLIQTRKKYCYLKNKLLVDMGITGHHWNCMYWGDDTKNYGEEWSDNLNDSSVPWHFDDVHKGYVVELGGDYVESMSRMSYLYDKMWADKFTKTIKVKVATYTAQLNLLSLLTLTFHVNDPSGIVIEKALASFKMYRSTHNFNIFIMVLDALYAAYTFYFTFYVVRRICRQKAAYFKKVWSFLDVVVVFISYNVIVVYICHALMVDKAVKAYKRTGEVMEFETVLVLDYYVSYSLALLVACAMLKFLNMLRFNPIIYQFLTILNRAKVGLICSATLLLIMFVQFGGMFHLVAAGKLYMFRDIPASLATMYVNLMGQYNVPALEELHPTFGPLAMLVYLVLATLLGLNIMISILIETLHAVNKERLPNDEARLLELLLDKVLQWLGIKKRPEDIRQTPLSERSDDYISHKTVVEELKPSLNSISPS